MYIEYRGYKYSQFVEKQKIIKKKMAKRFYYRWHKRTNTYIIYSVIKLEYTDKLPILQEIYSYGNTT